MKPIPDFPNYFADTDGNIYRKKSDGTHRKMKPFAKTHNKRYLQVALYRNGTSVTRQVHHLILETFIGPKPSEKHITRHKNDIGDDNRLDNLRWGTQVENKSDFFLSRPTKKNRKVEAIRKALDLGLSLEEVSLLSNWPQGKIMTLLSK